MSPKVRFYNTRGIYLLSISTPVLVTKTTIVVLTGGPRPKDCCDEMGERSSNGAEGCFVGEGMKRKTFTVAHEGKGQAGT